MTVLRFYTLAYIFTIQDKSSSASTRYNFDSLTNILAILNLILQKKALADKDFSNSTCYYILTFLPILQWKLLLNCSHFQLPEYEHYNIFHLIPNEPERGEETVRIHLLSSLLADLAFAKQKYCTPNEVQYLLIKTADSQHCQSGSMEVAHAERVLHLITKVCN